MLHLPFTKMHGAGNDFVVLDATAPNFNRTALSADVFRALANRHTGVGCDQILLVEPPRQREHDFYYGIYNSDGSEAGQCGNGARCFGLFVHRHKLSPKLLLQVGVGNECITIMRRSPMDHPDFQNTAHYRVNMNVPRFAPEDIPYRGPTPNARAEILMDGINANAPIRAQVLSMGNPHIVLSVDDVETAPVASWGPMLEHHPFFPKRVNVGFAQTHSPTHITLRVFERGAGETLACGSGACAAVVALIRAERLTADTPIRVDVRGGTLIVEWAGHDSSPVWMEGPAVAVFNSVFTLQ